jgi:hyperosmotically inducible protein
VTEATARGICGMRVTLAVAFAGLLACNLEAVGPTPSPGPAARVGDSLDQAWSTVRDQVADALLLTRIRVALLEQLGSDGLRVQISARDGEVELSGNVRKRSNREFAEQAARSVSGVHGVRNRIAVSSEGGGNEAPVARVVGKVARDVANAVLEGKVKGRLLEGIGRVALDIEVEARDGIVSLSGTVPDVAREKLAIRIAEGTPGVKGLHNRLTIKP